MILRATSISVTFGGVRAVDDVSLEVGDELVGVVGPNGSGKTTLLNAVTGVVPARGRLEVGGDPVPLGNPGATTRAGVARVFQAPQMFEALSCLENVLLSSPDRSLRGLAGAWAARPGMWRHERVRWARALDALDRVGLRAEADLPPSSLSYGRQRLLELARALASDPKVLLLDEPSAGLNDAETDELARLLTEVRSEGLPMLVIDHKVDFLDELCDRITVLELGKVIATGTPAAIWRDERVMKAYLGVAADAES